MNFKPILDTLSDRPIIDVRTPAEFRQGHLPGAVNMPLFTNEERHEVGLTYKTVGRDAAVKLGLGMIGPRLSSYIEQAESFAPDRDVTLYCWRGGMRSGSLSWLLSTAGFQTELIQGGYKTWRKAVHQEFETPRNLINLGGFTGTGKTELLLALKKEGEQIIDLEGFANHRGSAFGANGEQPSTEHFENLVGIDLMRFEPAKPVWVEDESRSIGKVYMPDALVKQMHAAPLIDVQRSMEERIALVCGTYGKLAKAQLIDSFERISKRMGGQFSKAAIEFIEAGNLEDAAALALTYYDNAYAHGRARRKVTPATEVQIHGDDYQSAAQTLITWSKTQTNP